MILSSYNVLKDCLEDDDDFDKLHYLLEQMTKYDAEKAFDMWYSLLKQYEQYVTERHVNETYNFVNCNLDLFGEVLGHNKFDSLILQDRYLYELLFKRYCYAAAHYNYTQKLVIRIMMEGNNELADNIFTDVYNNGNRTESWFEIMDGFWNDVVYDDFIPNEQSIALLIKWSSKIADKKERAKIMSSMLATGLNFDVDLLQQEENVKAEVITSVDTSDLHLPLIDLTNKYPQAINDRQVLRGLLSDFYPKDKLYVNILLMAYDEGLVSEICASNVIDYFMKKRMSSRLVNNYGITEKLADSAIEAWIGAIK